MKTSRQIVFENVSKESALFEFLLLKADQITDPEFFWDFLESIIKEAKEIQRNF